jgi:hypothetical protein
MTKNRLLNLSTLIAAVLAPVSIFSQTVTVTWDDLPPGIYMTPPSPTYDGYNWYDGDGSFGDVGSGCPLQYSAPGNPLSPPSAAYNAWGNTPIRVESLDPTPNEEFSFSGWFSGQPNLGTGAPQVEVEGFTGTSSTPAFTTTFTLPSDGSWVDENFTANGDYNKFLFSPLDTNGAPSDFLEGYIWMDNVQLTTAAATPDAGSSSLLLGIGISGLALLRRKLS